MFNNQILILMKLKLLALTIILFAFNVSMAQNYKFGKVSKEEVLQEQHPQDPEADAAILYREIETNFDYTEDSWFFMVTNVYERIKIYNKEGFDWASKKIKLYQGSTGSDDEISNLKAYTYYLDGSGKVEDVKLRNDAIFEEESNKYVHNVKFTMPDLKEGCVIEYRYTIKSPFISNIEEFRLQEAIPIDKINIRFASPEYFVFKTHQRGWVPYNIDKDLKDRTIAMGNARTQYDKYGNTTSKGGTRDLKFREEVYNIDLDNVPAMKEEAYAGNIDNYATALKLELSYTDFPGSTMKTYSSTWEDVSKSIYNVDLFGSELAKHSYFDDDLENLLAGVSDKDKKTELIFNYVKNKMSWNKYNGYYTNEGVKDAYKKGSGNIADINLMLVAMLRKAGLIANPVLVSTKAHGIPVFPTRNGFNYVIAAVEKGSDVVLLDATSKDAEVGVLQSKILNWQGRLIRKDGSSSWVGLSPKKHAIQSTMVNAELTEDLSLKGVAKNRFTGNYALKYRSDYKNVTEDDQRKKLEKDYKETELANVKFGNLSTTGKPVSLQYDFESFNTVEEVSGKLYLSPLLFMTTPDNPFKLEERDYPIDYGYPMKNRYIVNIDIPEGYTVESVPENTVYTLGENTGNFKYVISQTGNKLQLSVEFSINQSLVAANDYANLKKFYELMIAKESEKVVLSKV